MPAVLDWTLSLSKHDVALYKDLCRRASIGYLDFYFEESSDITDEEFALIAGAIFMKEIHRSLRQDTDAERVEKLIDLQLRQLPCALVAFLARTWKLRGVALDAEAWSQAERIGAIVNAIEEQDRKLTSPLTLNSWCAERQKGRSVRVPRSDRGENKNEVVSNVRVTADRLRLSAFI